MIEEAGSILYALFLSGLAVYFANRFGFFKLSPHKEFRLSPLYLLGIFATYVGVSLLILPLLYKAVAYFVFPGQGAGVALLRSSLSKEGMGWLEIGSFLVIFLAVVVFIFSIKRSLRVSILFGDETKQVVKNLALGAMTLLVAYPVVLFFNGLAEAVFEKFFGHFEVSQVAVQELLAVRPYPFLFFVFALVICTVIPFLEEVIFRGFLQTTLRGYVGRWGAIVLTSIIFALAHFSRSQGVGNGVLLFSLFVLSLFLCFLYERQRNIFASIGLHATFNLLSILSLLFTK